MDKIPSISGVHRRRSIRLKAYDYRRQGAYFITICTFDRRCLFGDIVDGLMRHNVAGEIVSDEWLKTADIRTGIELDAWTVMPNHFHGIIVVGDDFADKGTARRAPTVERFGDPVTGSVPTIVRSFKSAVTRRVNEWRQTPGENLWQRNYWEHVIRNEDELHQIQEYVLNNPSRWSEDKLYVNPIDDC